MSVGLVETKQRLRIHTELHNTDSKGMHRAHPPLTGHLTYSLNEGILLNLYMKHILERLCYAYVLQIARDFR